MEFRYQIIYSFVATLLLLYWLQQNKRALSYSRTYINISPICVILIIFFTFFIGLRPESVGADTSQYIQNYEYEKGVVFQLNYDTENVIFDNLFTYLGSRNYDISELFLIMAFIYFACIYVACRRLFPQHQEIAFFSYLMAFSTFSYGVNGMKAGVGAALFLVALAYREQILLSIVFAALSVGFHHSMIAVAVAYVISYFYKNTKMFIYGWLVCTLLAIAHISFFQILFASFASDKANEYLTGVGYITGFRPDFILYSAMPILIGYIMLFKKKIRNELYELWLRMYLTTNSAWMLCMYASYTNRIAYLSWFMYPIVLLIPFYSIKTSNNQFVVGKKVVLYHMFFTLFMTLIYYRFIH